MSTKIILMTLMCVLTIPSTHAKAPSSAGNESVPHTGQSSAAQKWLAADKALRDASAMAVKAILPMAMKASETLNLTSECSRGLLKFLMAAKQTKLWAFRMLDSFGKIPNGFFSGSINTFGDYDLCINTDIPGGLFKPQYCTLYVGVPLPQPRERYVPFDEMIPEFVNISLPRDSATYRFLKMARSFYRFKVRTSVCLPSTCTRDDLEQIFGKALETMKLDFKVSIPNCEVKQDRVVFDSLEIAMMTILVVLLSVAILGTVIDICLIRREQDSDNICIRLLLCFSLHRNFQRLLKKDDSEDSIKVFHGLKVITILWVIMNHNYVFENYQSGSNLLQVRIAIGEFMFQVVRNGFPSVQVFFFISAVLCSYGVMKMKGRDINVFMFVLRRIWRLTPPFMLVICCVFLIPHLGSGPVWKETVVDQLTERCKKNWWTNLVFINNFLPMEEMCLKSLWYIPVDTHLFILGFLVLVPLKRNPRLGLIVNLVLFCASIIVSAVLHIHFRVHPTLITVFNHPDDVDYQLLYGYQMTYLHVATYCIGLAVGYILATKPKLSIPLWAIRVGWLTAFALGLGVTFCVHGWQQGRLPSVLVSTLYATSNRFLFALALAWVTIACRNGYGGIVNSFLSWPAFVPLARLTYMTYLVHPLVIYMQKGSTKTVVYQEHKTLVIQYLATVMLSYMVALPLGLLFESPFMALEKVFLSGPRRKSDEDKSRDNHQGDQNYNEPPHAGKESTNGKESFSMYIKET